MRRALKEGRRIVSVLRRKGLGTDALLPCGRKEEATNPEQLFTGGFAFFTSKTEATVVHCCCRFWTGRVFVPSRELQHTVAPLSKHGRSPKALGTAFRMDRRGMFPWND